MVDVECPVYSLRAFVAITDWDWFSHLSQGKPPDEVNYRSQNRNQQEIERRIRQWSRILLTARGGAIALPEAEELRPATDMLEWHNRRIFHA